MEEVLAYAPKSNGFYSNGKAVLALPPALPLGKENIKGSYRISVAFFKTSHIVFDAKILYFDIGSKNVIGEKVENIDNVLKLKATFLEPFETNVTVITASGKYYSFLVTPP